MSYTTKDNTKEVLSAMDKAIERGLIAIGMTAERYAKEETPVDTGRLKNSITYALSGEEAAISSYTDDEDNTFTYEGTAPKDKEKSVYIGTNVEYSPYVENGARGRAPVHMLKKAATEHTAEYKKLMKGSMENA